MKNSKKLRAIKKILGDDAENVTVMWCSKDNAKGLTEVKSDKDEGALAAEIFEMLKRYSNAATIIKALCKADKIKTDPMADLFSSLAVGLMPEKED